MPKVPHASRRAEVSKTYLGTYLADLRSAASVQALPIVNPRWIDAFEHVAETHKSQQMLGIALAHDVNMDLKIPLLNPRWLEAFECGAQADMVDHMRDTVRWGGNKPQPVPSQNVWNRDPLIELPKTTMWCTEPKLGGRSLLTAEQQSLLSNIIPRTTELCLPLRDKSLISPQPPASEISNSISQAPEIRH